jgi:hypothetical protein
MSVLQVKNIPLLDALQLLMLFAGTQMYLERKLCFLIIFYSCTFLLIKILIVLMMNVGIHTFFLAAQ